jgi:transcriptional regulator with XRE-family HTH domain
MEGKFIMEQNVYVVRALSLQDFLARHPMKHEDLARLLGVCVDAVNSWSCGRRSPRPQVLTHLATLDERFRENPLLRERFVKPVPCTVC